IGGEGRERTVTIKARDPRAQARRGNARVEIDGRTLTADGAWLAEFGVLWGDQLATFYAEPRAMVRVTVKGDVARKLWPGTVVAYTSAWAATRDGAYGMTSRLGRVVSVERDLETLAATCEILVDAGDPTAARRFGPIARLVDDVETVEDRHDADARTVYCYADAFGRGGSASDVEAFAEPAWSTAGGTLLAYVWQSWDGVTWEKTAEFEVESVDAATNAITYKAGTLVGTIWERRFGLVVAAPFDDQASNSWPRAVFGVVCDSDCKFGANDLAGFPWVE
ncbi:MAG TPA: hypothetical protein VIK91_12485, partial [Nannocystis sp.]